MVTTELQFLIPEASSSSGSSRGANYTGKTHVSTAKGTDSSLAKGKSNYGKPSILQI